MGKRRISFFQYILYFIEYIFVRILAIPLTYFPEFLLFPLKKLALFIFFHTDKKNQYWANHNLKIIYKEELPIAEKNRILKNLYKNIIDIGIEFFRLNRINKNNYHKYVDIINLEALDKALSYKKGVLGITLHLSNWELFGCLIANLGYDIAVIINRQFNPFSDKWLMKLRLKNAKVKSFYNEVSDLTKMIKHLKQNGVLGIVADQTYYFKPIFVPFFGMNSATADGPAKLHLKLGSPIIFCYAIKENNKYKIILEDPVIFEKTDNFDNDVHRIMTWINQKYETVIIKYIDQWFSLLHGRWERTKPEDFQNIDWDPF